MADFLFTTLEEDARYTLQDVDGTEYTDTEVNYAINEARRYVLDELCRNSLFALMPEQTMPYILPYSEFSYDHKHDLPTDFYYPIRFREVAAYESIPLIDFDKFDDTDRADCAFITASKVGAPVPNSANTGTDTLKTSGDHTGATQYTYTITILAGGATFNWARTGSLTNVASCSTSWVTLENGVKVKFAAASGFTAGDSWTFVAYLSYANILCLNFDPDTDIESWHVRDVVPVDLVTGAISTTARLEFRRYYDALKLFVEIKLKNRSQESVNQDMAIFAPVSRMIMEKSSMMGDDQDGKIEPQFISEDCI